MGWKGLDHPGQRYSVKRDIFKKSNFEVTFLPARESPIETLQVMWYTQLVLRLGTEIFMISRRIKMLPSWAFLGPSRAGSRPSLKIPQKFQRLDISGMKTTKKPIANISLRFERKKNLAKNWFLGGSKMPPLGGPGALWTWAWILKRGVSNLVLAQNERLERVSSKSGSGRRQWCLLLRCNHS